MPKKPNLRPRRRAKAKASINRKANIKSYVPIPKPILGTGKVTKTKKKVKTTTQKLRDAITAFDRQRKKLGL